MDDVLTDSELMERSVAYPASFAELFDRHHGELYRYLRRRAGPSLAADIAAETFLTAFARRDRYRPDRQSVRPWLYGIAHNLLRNHFPKPNAETLGQLSRCWQGRSQGGSAASAGIGPPSERI